MAGVRHLERDEMARTAILAALILVVAQPAQADQSVRWYAVNQSLNEAGNSLSLAESPQKIELRGGWSCSISASSTQTTHSFREVTCNSGEKSVAFSVQCEPKRPKEHSQVRFKDVSGKLLDFIEVGCEIPPST